MGLLDDDIGLVKRVEDISGQEVYEVEAVHNGERGIDRAWRWLTRFVVLE